MKRRIVPQFDLPAMGEAFNLRIESATDGERVQREARERERARIVADQSQNALPLEVSAWRRQTEKILQ